MKEKFKFAGETVKIKSGVGKGLQVGDMSGMDFVIEDWCENVLGCHWGSADGNPAALEYAMRSSFNGANNNVPTFSNDVLYGKVGMFGHLFHVNELELPEV